MRVAAGLGAAASLIFAVSGLAAQSLAQNWSDAEYSTKETRALTHAYARCVVKRQAAKASEAIVANVGNDVLLHDYRMLIRPECLTREVNQTVQMRFGGDLYRYALADALVSRELAARPAPDLETVPRLVHHDPGEPPRPVDARGRKLGKRKLEAALERHGEAEAFAFLSRYGECIVRVDTAGARALLASTPDSAEEATRFAALRPALARCLPEGQTLRFGKAALRGSVAINYYRLAQAARPSAGGALR
ncbi:MAG TPA: hypothetical protein VF605_17455 [Allosphingosinicella sp.]|jgi:hypothetical protein